MTKLRGLRGATTADANTKSAIVSATSELLAELVSRNDLDLDDVAAAFFTTTQDLNAEFPAVAARLLGWTQIALMCGHEMAVPDAQPMCIRVMVLLNTDKRPDQLDNVYLRQAVNLRARGVDGE
jgi:chorismate mutase